MSRPLHLSLLLFLAFAACAPLNHRDKSFIEGRGLSPALHSKMLHHEPLTLDDIVELTQKGIPGPFIVHYLRPTYYVYKLAPSDVDRLRKAHVDEGVIRYLAATPTMFSPGGNPYWYDDDPHFNEFYRAYAPY